MSEGEAGRYVAENDGAIGILITWLVEQASVPDSEIDQLDYDLNRKSSNSSDANDDLASETNYEEDIFGGPRSISQRITDVRDRAGMVLGQLAHYGEGRWVSELLWPLLLKSVVNVKMLPGLPV